MLGIDKIRLEDVDIVPASIDGKPDVFSATRFTFTKSRWVDDSEASICCLCSNKFSQLRRKHHCRQCGRVLCSKCCSEKVPLPQLGIEEPERVCEYCKPVTQLVTKSRSNKTPFLLESAQGLSELVKDQTGLKKVVELGGLHTLIYLAHQDNEQIRHHVSSGLHTLSTHDPLHVLLAQAGAIKAVCSILNTAKHQEEQTLIDSISALMIFCKSADLKAQALQDGALPPILTLLNFSDAIALLALSTLSLIAEDPKTHAVIIESDRNALPRILKLANSEDEQMQEIALKILVHLSLGTNWHKHRIVQEDFTAGRTLLKALSKESKNLQVVCNAVCLVANLAVCEESQSALQDLLGHLLTVMTKYGDHADIMTHVSRGLANFAKFRQHEFRMMPNISDIISSCLISDTDSVRFQGVRCLLSLLSYSPEKTVAALMREGASRMLTSLSDIPGVTEAMQEAILHNVPEQSRPM